MEKNALGEALSAILLFSTLEKRLRDKGILSEQDHRIIFADATQLAADLKATRPDQAPLAEWMVAYLRHLADTDAGAQRPP